MKVKYQYLAIADVALNLLVEPEGMEPKRIRVNDNMVSMLGGKLWESIEHAIRVEFCLTGQLEFEDITPPMKEPEGGPSIGSFFGFVCNCCRGCGCR